MSTLGLDRGRKLLLGLRLTTHRGEAPAHAGGRWRPLSLGNGIAWCVWCGLCGTLGSLSLSQWRKVGIPLALWQKSWPNFKGLPKVSGVTTNHWVFLRCDWSLVLVDFITNPRLRKMAFFLI